MSEVITIKDLWNEIAKIYTQLGYKLGELQRLSDKTKKETRK